MELSFLSFFEYGQFYNIPSAKRQASLSIQEKQLEQLKERQSQYKKAAIEAKTHDDKELALKYMRVIKGMNPMIQAATNGLPVDMGQVSVCCLYCILLDVTAQVN